MKKTDYDVIIIGAGIGGLVCGCYLAKAGLKVLILEKNHNPGGCCCSFKRKGFTFDAGVFSLGDCRPEGNLGKIVSDLGLKKFIALQQLNPTEVIITPKHQIVIGNNLNQIIKEFQNHFPKEKKNIEDFFLFLNSASTGELYTKFRTLSFSQLLESYFHNRQLKEILKTVMATFGKPSTKTSAVTAAIVFKEFVIDGGYYPTEGGTQGLPDALVKCFRESGGKIKQTNLVKKIIVDNGCAKGVVTERNKIFLAKFIVSNIDATQTFVELVGKENLEKKFLKEIKRVEPSISTFMLFLGLKSKISSLQHQCKYTCTLSESVDNVLSEIDKNNLSNIGDNFLISSPSSYDNKLAPINNESVCILVSVPFKDKEFWQKNSQKITNTILGKVERVIPNLRGDVKIKEVATPLTYHKFTCNYNGAACGWAPTPEQVANPVFRHNTPVKNLFLCGHWTLIGFGVSRVSLSGFNTYRLIMSNYINKKRI